MISFKAIALAFTLLSAQTAQTTVNVAGSWKISGDVVGNPIQQICTFTQDGKKLTGSCKSQTEDARKPVDITGEVDENKVTWKFNTEYQGTDITVTFTSKVEAPSDFKGDIDVQPFAVQGTFTATKQDEKAAEPKKPEEPKKVEEPKKQP